MASTNSTCSVAAESYDKATQDVPKEVNRCLSLIAADMNSIRGLLDAAASNGTFHHIDHAIGVIAARSGALADLATKQMGDIQSIGAFADWMS